MNHDAYWWFEGPSVEHLKRALDQAGKGARLEAHPGPNDKLFLKVVTADGKLADPIDDSHLCPPDCE